jgi:hypothetical protein
MSKIRRGELKVRSTFALDADFLTLLRATARKEKIQMGEVLNRCLEQYLGETIQEIKTRKEVAELEADSRLLEQVYVLLVSYKDFAKDLKFLKL